MLSERPELSTRRAQEQADDLAGVRTGRALAPGALAWHLVLVDSSGSPPRQLCGRPGWHTPHMFDALTLGIPTRPVTENDELLQSAADTRNYGRLVRSESEAAEAALRRAAAMLKVPAEAEQASVMVPELISLAEAHGERLSTPDTDKRLQELLMALKGLGLRADEYVQKRFNLNRHEARAQVRGGKTGGETGGEHAQQRVQVVWSLRGGGLLLSDRIRLGNLRGDAAPAIRSMHEEPGRVRLAFACDSPPVYMQPPPGWDGLQPTAQRASVEEQHGPLHERGVYIGSVWYIPDAAALLTLYEQTTTQIPQSGRLDLSEGESRQITILTTQLAALTAVQRLAECWEAARMPKKARAVRIEPSPTRASRSRTHTQIFPSRSAQGFGPPSHSRR